MHTIDMALSNIKLIGQLFPNCLTERQNENGKVELAIDFDKLKQELSTEIVEGSQERYQFTWPGKREAMRLANSPTYTTLRPCRGDSVNFDSTENLYIEGDNLEVLKLLRENYLGRVKMIYIDPPYNTGGDLIYEDDFSVSLNDFKSKSGMFDGNGNMLLNNYEVNADSNGRFHTDWINMIYPRLKVARDLLKEDGAIFIHIDENEVENLIKICSEIFNESNFVSLITVKTKVGGVSGSSEGKSLRGATEYICVFAKNKAIFKMNPVYIKTRLFDRIKSYEAEGKSWKYTSIVSELDGKVLLKEDKAKGIRYYGYEKLSTMSIQAFASANNISVEDVYNKFADRIFQTTNAQSSVRQAVIKETKDFIFPMYSCEYVPIKGKNGGKQIEILYKGEQRRMMMFLSDYVERIDSEYYYLERISTLWDDIDYNNLTKEGDIEFSNGKKPIKLIQRMLSLSTEDSDIVMDFFSGSASTAHAVIRQNAEEKTNRHFIMVQLPAALDEEDSPFDNICELGKERIRRSGKQVLNDFPVEENNLFSQDNRHPLDIGFRVLKLDSSNMEDVYYMPESSSRETLFEDNVKPDRTPEDLLFQVMLECNLPLSAKIETKKIAGKDVFIVNDGYLVACFDEDVNETVITEVAKQKPYYFIMRDKSLSSDNVADNFEQIFNAYSKDTIRRIL